MWYVYILKTQNGNYYVGVTNNLSRRLQEHKEGRGGHFTNYNRAINIVYAEKFYVKEQADQREKQLKRWRRAKKEALINGNLEKLRMLSVSRD